MTQRVVGTVLLLCVFICLAAEPATDDSTRIGDLDHLFTSDSTNASATIGAGAPTINMFRYTLGLLVVLGMLAALYFVLKRVTGSRSFHAGDTKFSVLASWSLNNRQNLMLVRLLDVVYVLAVGPDKVETIDRIEDLSKLEQLVSQDSKQSASSFAGLLDKFGKKQS